MKVAGIQMRSVKVSVEENRNTAMKYIKEAVSNGAKLVCLPELFVTGYGIETELFHSLCETETGPTVTMFQKLAKELNVVLIVPFPERVENLNGQTNDSFFISAAVINSDGELSGVYRKSMLWGEEKKTFAAGAKIYNIYETSIGSIGVLICYDIEFPEPARLLALQEADIIVVPSFWSFDGAKRWDIQLPARALDNLLYILGVNAIGDGACGKTQFVDPLGNIIKQASTTGDVIIYGDVDKTKIRSARDKIPYMIDYPMEFTPGGMSN